MNSYLDRLTVLEDIQSLWLTISIFVIINNKCNKLVHILSSIIILSEAYTEKWINVCKIWIYPRPTMTIHQYQTTMNIMYVCVCVYNIHLYQTINGFNKDRYKKEFEWVIWKILTCNSSGSNTKFPSHQTKNTKSKPKKKKKSSN